jgi:uncharacterized protein YxjI
MSVNDEFDQLIFEREVKKMVEAIKFYNSSSKKLIEVHPDILDNYLEFITNIKKELGSNVSHKKWNALISSYGVIIKIDDQHSYSMYPQLYSNEHIHMRIAEYPSYIRSS